MHPTHHPFHTKAKAVLPGWFRHARPISGFFSDGLHIREVTINGLIEVLDKRDRLKVAIAAKLVGLPLTFFARVIEFQNGTHSIHPYSINVEHIKPKPRIADQK